VLLDNNKNKLVHRLI